MSTFAVKSTAAPEDHLKGYRRFLLGGQLQINQVLLEPLIFKSCERRALTMLLLSPNSRRTSISLSIFLLEWIIQTGQIKISHPYKCKLLRSYTYVSSYSSYVHALRVTGRSHPLSIYMVHNLPVLAIATASQYEPNGVIPIYFYRWNSRWTYENDKLATVTPASGNHYGMQLWNGQHGHDKTWSYRNSEW